MQNCICRISIYLWWEGGRGAGRRGLDTTNLRFHMTRVSERSLKAFVVSSFPHSCFLNILKVAFFTFRLSLSKDWTKKKLVMRKTSLFIWKETIHNFIKSETMRRVLFEPSRASYYIEYLCVSLHLCVGEIYIYFLHQSLVSWWTSNDNTSVCYMFEQLLVREEL